MLTTCNGLECGGCLQVDERFFATLMALNNQLDAIFPHAFLHYEDWTRQTWGGASNLAPMALALCCLSSTLLPVLQPHL